MNLQRLLSAVDQFKSGMQQGSDAAVCVAFSGGLDSTVLLHLLANDSVIRPRLKAIHVNHQLQTASWDWAEHCATVCREHDIEFVQLDLQIEKSPREGLESSARRARYQALYAQLGHQDILLTAHHQRDQAETFLLNLARGSGTKGLASMPVRKRLSLSDGSFAWHWRPLLKVPFEELQDYAQHHQLHWIEDPSNQDVSFRRNWIRQRVLPQFRQAWSDIDGLISRSADYIEEAQTLLQRMARQQLDATGCNPYFIDLSDYPGLDWVAQKNLLRCWADEVCGFRLGTHDLAWLHYHKVLLGNTQAYRKLPSNELRLYRDKLYYHLENMNEYRICLVDLWPELLGSVQDRSVLSAMGFEVRLPKVWFEDNRSTISLCSLKSSQLSVRKSFKKWFQKHRIPPWLRPFWPVLCIGEKPVGLFGDPRLNAELVHLAQLGSVDIDAEYIELHLSEQHVLEWVQSLS